MRKIRMIAIGVIAVSTAVWAHDPPGEVRNAVQFPPGLEPTIDGDCSDWAAVPGDQYWMFTEDLYPLGEFHPSDGLGRGENDASSFQTTYRVGWSASTGQLYYCNSVFDDVHNIDRPDSYDWYLDDSNEYFFTTRHLSEQEVRDLLETNVAAYWGFNYALPKLPEGGFWMVIGMCIGCEWLDNGDNEWYTLVHGFEGEEFGESTYHYEHRIQPIDSWTTGLGEDFGPDDITAATINEGQIVHITFGTNDDDGVDRGGHWSSGSGLVGGTWLGQGDYLLEPINPSISWPDVDTSVESESWGRIQAQF